LNVTLAPPREIGRGVVVAVASVAPGNVPKMDTSEPGATADPLPFASFAKLAALVTPPTATVGEELGPIVKEIAAETLPPLDTVIEAVPEEAIRPLFTAACNCVALTTVVGSALAFH
jgi:hypothetical protein